MAQIYEDAPAAEKLPGYEKGAPKDALSKIVNPNARKDRQGKA